MDIVKGLGLKIPQDSVTYLGNLNNKNIHYSLRLNFFISNIVEVFMIVVRIK